MPDSSLDTSSPGAPSRGRVQLLAIGCALALAACGADDRGPIRDVRERPPKEGRAPEMSAADRLGASPHDAMGHGGMGGMGAGSGGGAPSFTWTAPPGWEPLPKAPMREAGFRVGGHPDAECTLAVAGGSLLDNLNRWRRQMGLEPVDAAAVAALPKETFLGRPATYVALAGRYGGMRGDKDLADAKMVGLVADLPATSVFVKMVGPGPVVDAEMERFRAFAASVQPATGPAADPHGAAGAPHGARSAPITWTAPPGWVEGPAKPMRVVTLVPKGATRTECYVSLLAGTAGGAVANVNRWRTQMGLPEVPAAEIGALPRLPSMGREGIFVELKGRLDDPMRKVREDDALLYGFVVEREEGTVFVKMTGPTSEMAPERDAFQALCRSLEAAR